MRFGGGAIAAIVLFGSASIAAAATPYEQRVLAVLNAARANPTSYADGLRRYRTFFHANLLRMPKSDADIETEEGVAVVDETIAFLGRQLPLGTVAPAQMLAASAADHVAEQGRTGDVGHESSDGASPGERVRRRGGGAYVAEVIAYGPFDADDVIRQLIVDDGVADRGHRSIIFSPELRYAGVSCGPHPQYRIVCVIDLAITPDGHFLRAAGTAGAITQAAR